MKLKQVEARKYPVMAALPNVGVWPVKVFREDTTRV